MDGKHDKRQRYREFCVKMASAVPSAASRSKRRLLPPADARHWSLMADEMWLVRPTSPNETSESKIGTQKNDLCC